MKSPRAISGMAGTGLAACMSLVPWAGTVEAGDQVSPYTETKLTAADGAAGDWFGTHVAISGDTAVIGAYRDDNHNLDSGSAYVFERDPLDPMIWTQTAKLTAADGALGDRFGVSVAISGDTAVIGADGDDVGGSAFVFERDPLNPTLWTQVAKLTAPDGAAHDRFGISVATSGDTAVIGANEDDAFPPDSGSAYVFERNPLDPLVWTLTAKLVAFGGAPPFAHFGVSVAISGDTVVIGADQADDLGTNSGSAEVFERDPLDPMVWTRAAKLTASDGGAGDYFGRYVAIFGDTAVIGAGSTDDLGLNSGSAYVFEPDPLDPAHWTQTAKLLASDGDEGDTFGGAVAISGDTAVIGAAGAGDERGSAYVFKRDPFDPTVWTEAAQLVASDGAPFDLLGVSAAISGDTAVIGARYDDDLGLDSGSAYVYAPLVCELAMALEPSRLRAGEELRVAVDLHHRRPVSVTVPFLLWIENAAGQVVVQKSSPPITIEPGDHRTLRLAVTLRPGMPAGTYRVLVGVKRMQQGIAWASRQFESVE